MSNSRAPATVAIAGGGITGLAAAWALADAGIAVRLFEQHEHVSGVMRSERTRDGFLLEWGPSTIVGGPAVWALAHLSGTADELIEARESARKRYIVWRDRVNPVPASLGAFLASPLLSVGGKLRLLAEPLLPRGGHEEESVAGFARRRLGAQVLDRLVSPFLAGVYAGDAESISYRHGLARLYAFERDHGSLLRGMIARGRAARRAAKETGIERRRSTLLGARDGMQTWARHMAENLEARAPGTLQLGSAVTGVEPLAAGGFRLMTSGGTEPETFQAVLLALPHAQIPPLLPDADAARLLAGGTPGYAPVAIQQWMFATPPDADLPEGFGVLFTAEAASPILGILTPDRIFGDRAPLGCRLWTLFFGGARDPARLALGRDARIHEAQTYLRRLLGAPVTPGHIEERVVHPGICQVGLGHGEVLRAAESLEASHAGLFLAGNWRDGVGVPDRIEAANVIAARMTEYLARAQGRISAHP